MNKLSINLFRGVLTLVLMFIATISWAQNKVVVIPLGGDDGMQFPKTPFQDSGLIQDDDQALINHWIGENYRTWVRCYQLSDGASAATFHSQCDYKGPSVTVISLAGKVFGGYTENSWAGPYTAYRGYDRAFLFSLTEKKRYPIGYYPNATTYSRADYGPTFGNGHDIYINSTMRLGYCNFPYAFSYEGTSAAQPSNIACQELAGVDAVGTSGTINLPLTNIEVWVHQDQQ